MKHQIPAILLSQLILLLAGCGDNRERVSADYELATPERVNPDHHPGTALHYKGKQVWRNVYSGNSNSFHEGIFIFSAPIPGRDGQYEYGISPQLFAVQSAGPPIIISQRIIADTIESKKNYTVHEFAPVQGGLRVTFDYYTDAEHKGLTNCDIRWEDIRSWLNEVESSAPTNVTPLGTYLVLPMKRPDSRPGQ